MKKKSGFTIVELLIGMAVTMVALAAAVLMFRDSTKANTNITQTSGMSDNMRAGLNLIVQDLIQTGTGIPTGGISIPNSAATKGCNKGAQLLNRPPAVLKVTFDGPNSANKGCNVILPAIEPGNGLGPIVTSPDGTSGPATDIITIMYADNTLAMDQKPIISTTTTPPCNGTIAPDGSKITFDPACVTIGAAGIPVNTGDLLMIFNGNNPNGVLQYVSDVSGQVLTFSAGDPFNLNGRTASEDSGTILTLQNLTAGKPDGTYPPTSCSRVWMITYFLDATSDPKHPMLMRAVNFNTPQPRQPPANTFAPICPRRSLSAVWPISMPLGDGGFTMTRVKTTMRKQSGIALITTLLLLLLMSAMVVGFMLLVTEGQRLSGMNNEQSRAFYGAESGMEKITADLGALFATTYAPTGAQVDALATQPPVLPSSTGVSYLDVLGNSTYAIAYPKDINGNPLSQFAQIKSGSSAFQGMSALETTYTLTVAARTATGGEAKLVRTTQTVGIPLFQFGIFSDTDLSFFPGPNFDFGGRVHTNGNLFLDSGGPAGATPAQTGSAQLWLRSPVTATKDILRDCLSNSNPESVNGRHPGSVEITTGGSLQALGFGQGSLRSCLGSGNNPNWPSISD